MTPLILSPVGTKWLWLLPGGQEAGWDSDPFWTVEFPPPPGIDPLYFGQLFSVLTELPRLPFSKCVLVEFYTALAFIVTCCRYKVVTVLYLMSAMMELNLQIFVLPGDVVFGTCNVQYTCK
jgi:hypothetical protein